MNDFLKTEVKYLKGVGQIRAELLNKQLGIFRCIDLLEYYPFRYVDRSEFQKLSDIDSETNIIQIKGKLLSIKDLGYGKNQRLTAVFSDGDNEAELVWFQGIRWVKPNLKLNTEIVLYGKPTYFNGKLSFTHPDIDLASNRLKKSQFEAVYSATEMMRKRKFESKGIRNILTNLFASEKFSIPEIFDASFCEKYKLISREQAFRFIHQPPTARHLAAAEYRFKFEELFFLQFPFIQQNINREVDAEGIVFGKTENLYNNFISNHLPFELTGAQSRVLSEVRSDVSSGKQMNRLLQGDVGSGKTIVAFLAILMAVDNGLQAAFMAPTEILANQHYIGLREMADKVGIRIAILTGSTKASERKELHTLLRLGEIHLLIGTHALIEDVVQFKNLGLVIIDEQHRFGVAQRAKLQEKGNQPPHVMVMTATPIPRTLAMSVYGDLDYSVIDEMPAGRKTIKTAHRFGSARHKVWDFIKSEIEKGRQAYVVYPLIEESETMNYKNLNEGYDELLKFFPRPEYQVDMIHGRMKPSDKDAAMLRFKDGITNILVSTTVIEVGINVPNASIMVIESAEKFGLSQLHQLRGRVGRGAEQSYCILMSNRQIGENAQTRLKAMVNTASGFELSEIDMQLRGFGDIAGTRQSGIDQLRLANLSTDSEIAALSRKAIGEMLRDDPELENQQALKDFIAFRQNYRDWIKIA